MAKQSDGSPPTFEIPDLDLGPAKAPGKASLPPATAKPALSAKPPASAADDFEFGDGDDFELETVQASLGFGMDTSDAPALSGGPAQSSRDSLDWPSGAPPSASALAVDTGEVERVAAFGDASGPLLLLPLYTARVFTRRRELGAKLRETSSALLAVETKRDTILSELARGRRAELDKHEAFAPGLAELAQAAKLAGEHEQSLAATSAQVSSELGAIDGQIAELGAERDRLRLTEGERLKRLEQCEANLKRAEARVKRAQIEIRSLHDVAIKRAPMQPGKAAPTTVALSKEETARLAALEEQQRNLAAEVLVVKGPYLAAQSELEAVQKEQRALEQRVRAAEQRKSSYTQKARQELNSKGQQANQAEARLLAAAAELGRGVLAARGRVPVDPALLERVRHADREVLRAAREHELYLHARAAYDREKAKQGMIVIFCAIGLVLGLLIWLIA